MKKFAYLSIIMTLLSLFIPSPSVANAQSTNGYARIINDNTPFFSDSNGLDLLFYLPYTYYVKVIETQNEFLHVEYGGYSDNLTIDGYVLKSQVYFDELVVSSPYPNVQVQTCDGCALYKTSSMLEPVMHIFKDRTVKPYGTSVAPDGSIVYFVSYNNTLGYVYEKHLKPFTLNNHSNPLTFLKPEVNPPENSENTPNDTQTNPTETSDFFSLRIVIIICLVFAGIIAFFVAMKHGGKKAPDFSSYYDENDYE